MLFYDLLIKKFVQTKPSWPKRHATLHVPRQFLNISVCRTERPPPPTILPAVTSYSTRFCISPWYTPGRLKD